MSETTTGIVTFANLGRKRNLKTPDILPVIEAFLKQGSVRQIICQVNAGFPFPGTSEAPPAPLRYMLRFLGKVVGLKVPRQAAEALFDWWSASLLACADAYLLHAGYSLPRTFRRARSYGGVLIDLTATAHIAANARLESEELRMLNVLGYEGFYKRLLIKHKHVEDFDYAIAMSEFVKESYVAAGFDPGRVFVASPDIDLARFRPVPKKEDIFRLLYVGYTTPLKGLHYLLDAWESLNLAGAELVLVGGYGDMPDALRRQYEERIRNCATIRQEPSVLDPERYYSMASAFAFPSLTEGFGRVTLEAMACGIPVITTENARGIVEDGKTGFVVPIRDANAFADKIRYLYDHPEERRRMGEEARRAVMQKPAFGEAVLTIYRAIMKREGIL